MKTWVALVAVMAIAVGCGGGTSSAGSTTKVVIGYEQCGACALNVTIVQKYFQKYMNADIELRAFDSGPAALAALASGSLQFMTEVGPPPVVRAIQSGLPLSLIWIENLNLRSEGLVVRDGYPVNSVSDLKGKSLPIVVGSGSEMILYYVLKQAGVPFDSVQLVNLSPPAMQAAWDTKNINMYETWQPVYGYGLSHGGHILFTNSLVVDVAPSLNLDVVNTNWAKQHPDLVKGFVQAMNAGVVYTDAHPDEALAMMTKFGGISLDEGKIEYPGYETLDLNQQLTSSGLGLGPTVMTSAAVNGFVSASTFLVATGNLSSAPSRAEFAAHVDPSFVQEVAASS